MTRKVIVNTKIITPENIIDNGVIMIEKGRIVNFGKSDDFNFPKDAEIIDAKGIMPVQDYRYSLSWGGTAPFHINPETAAEAHLKHGTTSILATIAYSISREDTIEGIKK